MAYDEGLAQRIREQLADEPGFAEKRMFGGIAFLEHGNMTVGVLGDELIARVGPDEHDAALSSPGTRIFDITGRPMRGWVLVAADALTEDDALAAWIKRARGFVATLPNK